MSIKATAKYTHVGHRLAVCPVYRSGSFAAL